MFLRTSPHLHSRKAIMTMNIQDSPGPMPLDAWPIGAGLFGFSERALAAFFYELATTEVSEEHHVLIP